MNSSKISEEKGKSKRHKSVINPSMEEIQIFESGDIITNNNNFPLKKIKLRSNSLFAYQEFDKYTSLFGINNIEKTSSSNNSSFNNNSEEEDEYSDNFPQNNKKRSVGNIFYPSSNLIGFNNYNSNQSLENNINNNLNNNINSNINNNINKYPYNTLQI